MMLSLPVLLWVLAVVVESAPLLRARDSDLVATRCPDFCAGTNSTKDETASAYICGDPRLGPSVLPAGLPLEGIAGIDSTYHRFGGLCPGDFLAKWTNASTGQFVYPPHDGYALTAEGVPAMFNYTLEPGTYLDRFGSEYGAYMSPAGAAYAQRSLPPTNLAAAPGAMYPYNYRVYTVAKNLTVQGGAIAGWFGQQGLGLQFLMPKNIMTLVNEGYLNRVNLTADPNW
ncbi:hypothetical protein EJ05DRAFT_100734 [Pseudovirgaria hyperparasitica]|uniref:TNT domain-containing protein n=1 Tax=Pseudovirgaria hyperparasitica TaxID=470096 RepID=A0A6A6VXN0_9PEZI|nr:uncharacterized protein EJ05DRAFT_100734 [Pseudovirgaria hyperparasitica]KAF2755418.1 hypothetical protein EJ05DRAFT_100734 [Pseudovirgaria hyperparasitica]